MWHGDLLVYARKRRIAVIKRFINSYKVPEEGKKLPGKTLTLRVALAFIAVFLCLVFIATSAYALFEKTVTSTGNTITATGNAVTYNTFTHSDNLAHTDTYLYRVGNGNTVTLGTLFKVDDTPSGAKGGSGAKAGGTPTSANVKIKVESVDTSASVTGSGTNLEDGSTAKCVYTRNASDWTQSTLKFTGEGPVSVTIKEGDGEAYYTLNLEVVTGNNFVEGATLNGNADIVLLGNVKVGASSGTNPALYLSGKNLYGNGFEIDATGSNISTMGHGIISLTNSSIDNAIIIGPMFTTYQGTYNNDYFGSTVLTQDGTSYITNCRITGAASPLRIKSEAYVSDTVLSGGLYANMQIKSGSVTVENVMTINTQNSLGIVFDLDCGAGSTITINGTLTQHNFVSQNTNMSNSNANTLKNNMFGSSYSKYQFSSDGTKYVNTGILSFTSNVGASDIIDNRSNKKNYSGQTASLLGQSGYVYTMENTDSSMLETSYTEPTYIPSAQVPYSPAFSWSVPSGDNVAAGGDAHCYKDDSGVLQIQFLTGGSKTINASNYATFKKYGATTAITPSSITCVKNASGASLTVTNGSVTFTEAGEYTISYHYNGVHVYDKDLGTTTTADYTKTIKVNVNVKKVAPNAVITVSQTNGTMIWGSAGNSFDRDYQPAAQIFDYMTITDYDDDGNPYTVLDGSNQAAFLNSIASVVADSDNKTGFTINFPDGTKLVIKCGAPYNSGTLQFKKLNNKFLMCGSVAYNNPTAATWYVNSYTYTGHNGVAVTYGKRGFTSTTDSTNSSLSNLSNNKFLMYDAQGGTVSPSYTGTSPATLPTPTREGYTFQNWNTKADGTGTARNAGTSMSFSSTTTLYAIWAKNVTVTFSSEGSTISTLSAGAGATLTLPSPTQTSQWLEGWYTEESGGTKIGNAGASFTIPSSDTTYYAHWSPKYGVTYNANGGTVSTPGAVYEGTALILPTPTNGAKTFEGWFTAAEGGTPVGTGGDSYTPTADIELFAQWSDNILVTFDGNGGTAGTNSATYDNATPIMLPTATWAGHQFNGWYTEISGGTKIGNAGDSYVPTEPTTLHAQWTAYTVTYDANNGSVSPASASAGDNGSVTLPTPTRTGYTFNGWYTEASDGTKVGNAGASYTPTADITLHAQWTQQKFTVTISAGSNGSVSPTSIANVPYGTTISVSNNTLTINGTTVTATATANSNYSFDKWSVSNGATVTSAMTITASFKSSGGGVGCVAAGTLITLADGTKKPVEELTGEEMLLVWDFDTASYSVAPIVFIEPEVETEYSIINVVFEDETNVEVSYEHGFFDYTLGKYIYINEDNPEQYIGHEFIMKDGDSWKTVKLTSVEHYTRVTTIYGLTTFKHFNFFNNDMLSIEGNITGMFNYFDVDLNTMGYDQVKKQADIEKYGLLTYEDFEGVIDELGFEAYNGQYLSVSIGKRLITWDGIKALADYYGHFTEEYLN